MTYTLTLPLGRRSLVLKCHYLPAIRSKLQASTGYPVEPDTAEEFEILSATIDGVDVWDDLDGIVDWGKVEKRAREQL